MIHTASPFFFGESSEDELIKPAVQGTLSVLKVYLPHPGSSHPDLCSIK